MRHVLVTVHSGGSTGKSNSREYLEQACLELPDILEVDVRASKDGRVVLWHDEHLPGDSSPIGEQEFQQLEAAHHSLLSLANVLAMCTKYGIRVNLDIKMPEAIEPVKGIVEQHGCEDQLLFSGCQEPEIEQIHRLLPTSKVLFNADKWDRKEEYPDFVEKMLDRTHKAGAYALNICHEDVRPYLLVEAGKRQVPVYVWTVDDQARMEELVALGVSSITTHQVRLLKTVLERTHG